MIVDDDIAIRRGFFDRFLGLLEHFDVAIAQPALTRMSYLTWLVTRRRPFSLVRETWYVEPQLTAFRSDVVGELLPFPRPTTVSGRTTIGPRVRANADGELRSSTRFQFATSLDDTGLSTHGSTRASKKREHGPSIPAFRLPT